MIRKPKLPPDYRLVKFDVVDSTNIVARRLAVDENAPHGTVVVSERQEAGRGRRGNVWSSPPGNLYSSFILRPKCSIADATQISFIAALAVADTIISLGGDEIDVWCKWPNDVLVGAAKIAGILLECEGGNGNPDFIILGIGINIASHPTDTPYATVSLANITDGAVDIADVLEVLADRLLVWSDIWSNEGFSAIRAAWLQRAKGKGEAVTVRLATETLEGIFDDLDHDGALIIASADGNRRVTAGEVFFGRP